MFLAAISRPPLVVISLPTADAPRRKKLTGAFQAIFQNEPICQYGQAVNN
jgi:hypothetical protein